MSDGSVRARRSILHIDMDAFYVACEVRRRPELVGKAVIVGGSGDRGVVAAASYEARRYGVHSAMSSVRARRLCPHAIVIHGDHGYYGEVSARVHEVFDAYTPIVEPIALDEAFLDVTGSVRLFGAPAEIGRTIRDRIADELQLSASVGIASTKLVAKLASEAAKPTARPEGITVGRGVVEVSDEELVPFLQAHPVTAMWGVGPKTFERLQRLGVSTIGDLAAVGEAALVAALGVASGQHLHRLALGVDDREVVADRRAKSIGHEETFSQDRHGRAELHGDLVRLTESVAARLRSHSVAARTVSIKVRFGDFTTITRSITVSEPVDTGPDLLRSAGGLLDHVELSSGVRLLGVSGSQLVTAARQLSLDDLDGGWGGATDAIDEIRRRFGSTSIGPARLQADRPTGESTGRARPGLWGPERSD